MKRNATLNALGLAAACHQLVIRDAQAPAAEGFLVRTEGGGFRTGTVGEATVFRAGDAAAVKEWAGEVTAFLRETGVRQSEGLPFIRLTMDPAEEALARAQMAM